MANNTIYIKKTAVAGRAPNTSNIGQGELAVNMTDQKLFSTNGSVVFEIGANLTSSMVGNSTANVTSNTSMLRIANSTASANLTPDSLTIGTSTVNSTVIQAATLAANGNVTLGTQANKATVTYTTNTARTYTLPDAGANASFVMTEGSQTIPGAKTFSGGIGVREGSPTGSSTAVFTYTLGHGNTNRYGLYNTLIIDNSSGDLTADRTAQGVYSVVDTSIQNSLAFTHTLRAVYGVARTTTTGGNSIDGEGFIYGGDFSVNHQSTDATYNKIQQARGVSGVVQTSGSTAYLNLAYGVYSSINPTNATSTINSGYLFFGTVGTGTGTFNNRWGVYINSPINNYFNGGLQVGGSAVGSTSSAGLGVGVAPSGTSGTISMNGNLTGVANLVMGTQANKATITYATNTVRTYTLPDAGADASFVMSEGTQTINGAKTFSNNVAMSANLAVDTDALFVDGTNSRVGIGNTIPRSKLHVYGAGQTTAAITDAGSQDAFLRVSDSGSVGGSGGGIIFASLQSDDTGAVGMAAIKGLLASGNDNTTGDLAFSTRNATTDTALTERMRLTANGNFGIGNTAPTERLHIQGSIRVANAYVDAANSKGTAGQVLTSNSTHAYWAAVGAATNLVLTGSVTEDIFAITDGASVNLDPTNGSIQTWTLGATRTPGQANWSAGQGITLMVDDGSAYSITWTTLGVVWKSDGGVAPTLNTTGYTVIALWKVGTTIYGARVGNA